MKRKNVSIADSPNTATTAPDLSAKTYDYVRKGKELPSERESGRKRSRQTRKRVQSIVCGRSSEIRTCREERLGGLEVPAGEILKDSRACFYRQCLELGQEGGKGLENRKGGGPPRREDMQKERSPKQSNSPRDAARRKSGHVFSQKEDPRREGAETGQRKKETQKTRSKKNLI